MGLLGGLGAIAGGIFGSKAADKAAKAQQKGAEQASQTQRYMYDTTRKDFEPFRQTGVAASNRLSYLMGLDPGGGGVGSTRAIGIGDLVDTSGGDWRANQDLYANSPEYRQAWDSFISSHNARYGVNPNLSRKSDLTGTQNMLAGQFDLNAYNAAQRSKAEQSAAGDPLYGSLTRRFSMDDLSADPVYQTGLQFGLDEGNKAIERQAAASGNMLSGATLKALSKYATDYAGTKAGEAYNRFNTDQANLFNRLSGLSGAGQQAVSTVAGAGQNMANQVAQNQIGAANARAASAIGKANAWSDAIGGFTKATEGDDMTKMFTSFWG